MTLARYKPETELAQAQHTRGLDDDELRRVAVRAATERDPDALWTLVRAYLEDTTDKGNLSRLTFKAYRHGVGLFVMANNHENLLRPSRRMGSRYRAWLKETPFATGTDGAPRYRSPSTVNKTLAAARVLYRALHWAGATDATPFASVKGVHDPVPAWEKVQPYPQADLGALLAVSTDPADRVALLLCAHAGLRAHEAAGLEWRAIDWRAKRLQVRGKGGYVDSVALSSSLMSALKTLQADTSVRRKGKARAGKVLPYADERLRQRLKALCGAAGVDYRALHPLRHQSGTRMYEETGDLRRTQTHLRHKNIATTTIYAKVSEKAVADVTEEW
jgi:integrase/recombinase XerC